MNRKINRRSALQSMLYIAGGTLILPACVWDSGRASIELTHIQISESDELFLESLVESLIPKSDTPGGKEFLLHLFVLKMVDDCQSPESQRQFETGLDRFTTWAEDQLSMPFVRAERKNKPSYWKVLKAQEMNL